MNLLPVLSALFHLYVGFRLVPALAAWPVPQAVLAASLIASAVLMPLGLRLRRDTPPRHEAVVWAGLLFMGLFSSLFVLTLLRDAALGVAGLVWLARPQSVPLGAMSAWTAWGVIGLSLAITLAGFLNARRVAAVRTVDIPIEGLPAALDGFTIAQLSDIHVGPTIKGGHLSAIVERVNAMSPDMVAITGDLVDGTVRELSPHVAPLAALRSRHGTYFVTGNHEYYSGAHAWIDFLRQIGIQVLLNEHVVLRHGGAPLVVAGVADYSAHHFDPAHRSDAKAAARGSPRDAIRVLLAHQPRSAEAAAEAGFALQLSGHTHGGQFLPWNFFVRLQQPFTAGLHRLKGLWVYTSRGTGYWGPPKRFGAPSEITRVRLVASRTERPASTA